MAIVLIGFMGAGKSTAARELAQALGVQPRDSDALLERELGHSIAEEFESAGEAAFREREERVVVGMLAAAGPRDVLSLGGGSVLSERVRRELAPHLTVLLDVRPEVAWRRVSRSGTRRPLARDREAFGALHASRRAIYEELADAFLPDVPAGGAAAALPALQSLARAPAGTRLVWARAASGEYPVLVGRGLLNPADPGQMAELWPAALEGSRRICITDETVAEHYGATARALGETIAIPAGERHKTLAQAERVWEELVRLKATRADHVAALGGGVVGDLAGFCASAYQRGVPVVQLPTTLVAQVDSAYGGKTGVDLPQAKNYVGAYHQPAGVIADTSLLQSLPERELAAGWVEVLKTALIAGGPLWERVLDGAVADERTILDCARTKLAVVAADERDEGRRQVLNLGHTVGHAIETVTAYRRYRHGEAVGLGLLAALRLSGQPELREQVRALLVAHDLPVTLQGADAEAVIAATERDKKRLAGKVPFVLLDAPGEVRTGCEVEGAELRAAVTELL